ncbi:hypothetical protein BS50DRAFT_486240 [Corynespora cassiicola Philippines]|uniref:Uncharacterized protein n=1 Tax=Corynespora cassiicola Philippines TaxID=1448308 RepID=A0A2T2P183_CORCC|nr:hypothetical protein BS50DRAFT_486240 [Corynespora cassiicola Philippines]
MVALTLLTLAAGAAAAPALTARQQEIPEGWTWQVENWHAGCQRAGCNYNFNITVPTVEGDIAGVKAYCSGYRGYDTPDNYNLCQILEGANNGVSAKFGPRPEDGTGPKEIFISFEKGAYEPEGRPAYNFTGSAPAVYNAFVAPLLNFTVTPTQVTAVA